MKIRALNNYAGLGGNRKNWKDCQVTAVEKNPEIAALYQKYYPADIVIVGDAHKYLEDHYQEFDFIWSSPPCPTHSRARMWTSKGGRYAAKMPDMTLYSEIIFLQTFAKCPFVVENVKPYYKPLLLPSVIIDRHCLWSNFDIDDIEILREETQVWATTSNTINYGYDLSDVKINHRKDQLIRNLVNPLIGEHIFNSAFLRQEQL